MMQFPSFLKTMVVLIMDFGYFATSDEYCRFEGFKPTCNSDEVVVMKQAIYGRMEVGKCVKNDYGHLGCQLNALDYFDTQCSGKSKCEIEIPNEELSNLLDCLGELYPYLKAEYVCQKVFTPPGQFQCHETYYIQAGHDSVQYLASTITQQTKCGLNKKPWIISAQPGQRMKLSLLDFSKNAHTVNIEQNPPANDKGCVNMKQYGYIVDTNEGSFVNICGGVKGGDREVVLYETASNDVQIVLDRNAVETYSFLIKYEVLDCPEIVPPSKNYWVQISNNTATVGCYMTNENWRLSCVKNIWLGSIGNCSAGKEVEVPSTGEQNEENNSIFSSNHVLAFTFGCVTLIVCCGTVIVGFYCIKRFEVRKTIAASQPTESLRQYDNATIVPQSNTGFNHITTSTLQGPMNIHSNHQRQHPYLYHQPLVELSSYPFATMGSNHHHQNKPPPIPKRSTSYHGSMQRCHLNNSNNHGGNNIYPYYPQNPTNNLPGGLLTEGNPFLTQILQPQKVPQQQNNNNNGDEDDVFSTNDCNRCNFMTNGNSTVNPTLLNSMGQSHTVNNIQPTNSMGFHNVQQPMHLDTFNSNMNDNYCVETAVDPVTYFVLENPRESVTSETDSQLYQSIHYKSTDHITSK